MSQNAFQNERLGTVEPGLTLINAATSFVRIPFSASSTACI